MFLIDKYQFSFTTKNVTMPSTRIIKLTPPLVSADHVNEKITCIRAHRERLFRVEAQTVGNKIICHNYGQGGAGWTFLFEAVKSCIGMLELEVEKNPAFKNKPIAIVGAGCYGLLTAIELARKGHAVRIIAKDDYVASNKAAGFFFPRHRKMSSTEEIRVFERIGIGSYKTYLQIIRGEHPFIKKGPRIIPAYYGPMIDPGFEEYIKQGLVNAPEKVRVDFGNGKVYDMIEYHAVFMNPGEIFAQLQRVVREMDIPLTYQNVTSLNELPESIIFNCAGLGAKELANDSRIVPVQGHLITLKNQPAPEELNYMINTQFTSLNPETSRFGDLIYYAPKGDGILGITFKRGESRLEANPHEFDRLLERSHDFFGSP